ncbi:MAG TPA: hypothetical protein VK660_00745, partial [Xanthomonadaceae bacterium]|nr:hypothetical protein [Xanthomonadaceae bacterium]
TSSSLSERRIAALAFTNAMLRANLPAMIGSSSPKVVDLSLDRCGSSPDDLPSGADHTPEPDPRRRSLEQRGTKGNKGSGSFLNCEFNEPDPPCS